MRVRDAQWRYFTTLASDLPRDAMCLELYRRAADGEGSELIAEATWYDSTSEFRLTLHAPELPVSLIEQFVAEARDRLAPTDAPAESNAVSPDADDTGREQG